MNPEQLWETTMNPENRILVKANNGRCYKSRWNIYTINGRWSEPRREFIQANAKYVKNLIYNKRKFLEKELYN